jgi:CDP-diacylglycerol--glycerol-3-phosphate 3-phosphatidyltransferase
MSEVEPVANDPIAKYRAKDDLFTPSNLISIMRVMFVMPAIFCIMAQLYFLVAAIFVAAVLTDLLDGIIARKTDSVTELGKIVDPLADKIFIGLVVVTMAFYGLIPIWFIIIILARDLVILAGGVWAKKKLGVVLPSNYPGKIAVITIALTLFLIVIRAGISGDTSVLQQIIVILEWLSVALMALSLWVYGRRLAGLLAVAK